MAHAPENWIALSLVSPMSSATLAETLDGGQCFRWSAAEGKGWHGITGRVAAELHQDADLLHARVVSGSSEDLRWHLAADTDWNALADQLPWRSDPHLARCLQAFPGLRILRQPIGETLLGFLCSATKQIVQIKQMIALLASRFGTPLAPGRHALPTWPEIAALSEAELRACLLGFRARHVRAVAELLAASPGWLEAVAVLPYIEAKQRLMTLPGVGAKIADCVLLFGAGKLEAFPVDVWILRTLAVRYGLDGWSPGQAAHFGRVHFGTLAGLAQQYLFAWERRHGVKMKRDDLAVAP